jgi:YaaC-like Protein
MPLPAPRNGESLGFGIYPEHSSEATLGNPETVIWSSINHLCSRSAAQYYVRRAHRITNRNKSARIAQNLRLYIQQAFEFYQAAADTKPNTAPLIYYYSFLNLAKAVCEMRSPGFHRRRECYAHGLNWRPDPRNTVNFLKEKVRIGRRGVWHTLCESLMRIPCSATDGTQISVKSLFSFCPEITAEFGGLFFEPRPFIEIDHPSVWHDKTRREVWLTFSVERDDLRSRNLSGPKLISQMATNRSTYIEVRSKNQKLRTYESATPAKVGHRGLLWVPLEHDILGLNLITHFGTGREIEYSFPLQKTLPLRLPQLVIGYTILFWLGSLVRYDPHSVAYLMDSPVWILIDGFMTQSRVWLLELFNWALYQKQTTLRAAR